MKSSVAIPLGPYGKAKGLILLALVGLLAGCSAGLKIYPTDVPPTSLRLGEVSSLASKQDIKAMGKTYQGLLASGLKDGDIQNGSLGSARVFCCGGLDEEGPDIFFYIPKGIKPGLGDIVEIRSGTRPQDSSHGKPNTLTRIVQKRGEDGQCDWVSKERFIKWNGILYCDWMPAEHWTSPLNGNSFKVWYKLDEKSKTSGSIWPF
jgi:hypothetical protein